MACIIKYGPWAGSHIRRAVQPGICAHAIDGGGYCTNMIESGELYMEFEYPAGRGDSFHTCERWCLRCAGKEAREAAKLYSDDRGKHSKYPKGNKCHARKIS